MLPGFAVPVTAFFDSPNPMNYLTDCPCGKVLTVLAADAGAKVRCECGREVQVPSLSLLRRLDPLPGPPPRPPVDYAFLRVPGFVTALGGVLLGCGSGSLLAAVTDGANSPAVWALPSLLSVVAQIVGVALVCVSKRFPILVCIILPPFGLCGPVVALFLPERLPPVPPPPR